MSQMFIDISVKDFSGAFTRKAKPFDVGTQILLKVPAWSLTTVRLSGSLFNLTEFLRSLTMSTPLTEADVRMHVHAAKPVDGLPVHWKNRLLMENRNA